MFRIQTKEVLARHITTAVSKSMDAILKEELNKKTDSA